MQIIFSWIQEYRFVVSLVASVSLVLLAISILAAPWAVGRLPADYLLNERGRSYPAGLLGKLIIVLRTLTGFALVLLGLLMMLTPGPGLIVKLLGISITEFPGKHRLFIYIATRPRVFTTLNWLRGRHGKSPFIPPAGSDATIAR